ncbi:MAG: dihydrolipoyl dehydrogenase [Rikenellaceae bacterium]|jgi:dihydrolipoamide dehydrogenase|nr:dihydrolipoyl dehydrogenase [Rikenellaceae bacterium]
MRYDIIIIGGGPGGYAAALRAAELGRKVAIVERAQLGGICLNWGCIPSKALLKSAQVYAYAREAAAYGVTLDGSVAPDLERMVERSRGVVASLGSGLTQLLKSRGIEVIAGRGSLRGAGVVCVSKGGETSEIEADHIIVATGSRARDLPFAPMDGEHIINYRQAMSLRKIPESMVVIGSGAIGSEFGYFYATLGTRVTILEYMPQVMPLADEEVSRHAERAFRRMKIEAVTSANVRQASVSGGRCTTTYERNGQSVNIESEVVLAAVGVKSNIEHIGLEETGVVVERDKVVVDSLCRTSAPGIYAIGDVIATPALAHVASAEGILCVEAICGLEPKPIDYTSVPSCIYTVPEVAQVGLTQREAEAQGIAVKVGVFRLATSGKATAAGEREGLVKLIFDAESKRLIGGHAIGANVSELLGEITLAKTSCATITDIANTIHCHPTLYESIAEAARAAI